jgi:hypothetical protein
MAHSVLAAAEVLLGRIFSRKNLETDLAIVQAVALHEDCFKVQLRYEYDIDVWWEPKNLDFAWEPRFATMGAMASYHEEVERLYGRPECEEMNCLWSDAWGDLYVVNKCSYTDSLEMVLELEFADKHLSDLDIIGSMHGRHQGEISLGDLRTFFRKIND